MPRLDSDATSSVQVPCHILSTCGLALCFQARAYVTVARQHNCAEQMPFSFVSIHVKKFALEGICSRRASPFRFMQTREREGRRGRETERFLQCTNLMQIQR